MHRNQNIRLLSPAEAGVVLGTRTKYTFYSTQILPVLAQGSLLCPWIKGASNSRAFLRLHGGWAEVGGGFTGKLGIRVREGMSNCEIKATLLIRSTYTTHHEGFSLYFSV